MVLQVGLDVRQWGLGDQGDFVLAEGGGDVAVLPGGITEYHQLVVFTVRLCAQALEELLCLAAHFIAQLVCKQQAVDLVPLGAQSEAAAQEQLHLLDCGPWGAEQHLIKGGQELPGGLHVDGQGSRQHLRVATQDQVRLANLQAFGEWPLHRRATQLGQMSQAST